MEEDDEIESTTITFMFMIWFIMVLPTLLKWVLFVILGYAYKLFDESPIRKLYATEMGMIKYLCYGGHTIQHMFYFYN